MLALASEKNALIAIMVEIKTYESPGVCHWRPPLLKMKRAMGFPMTPSVEIIIYQSRLTMQRALWSWSPAVSLVLVRFRRAPREGRVLESDPTASHPSQKAAKNGAPASSDRGSTASWPPWRLRRG